MSGWFIYLLTRIDYIRGLLIAIAVILGVGITACLIYAAIYRDTHSSNPFTETSVSKWLKKLVTSMAITIFITIMIPNLKEIAAIYVIPKIVNNEQCQQLPTKMMNLLNTKLDQWFDESLGLKKK